MELRIWKRIYLTPSIRLNLYTRGHAVRDLDMFISIAVQAYREQCAILEGVQLSAASAPASQSDSGSALEDNPIFRSPRG